MFKKCPGLYCGRIPLLNDTFGECGPCPSGFRSTSSYPFSNSDESICVQCSDSLNLHDWLYLLFMGLSLLLLECAAIEVATASLISILIKSDPWGNFSLKTCRVVRISDWYTIFFNPSPNYTSTIRCTQEAVYPLYSIIFIFYALALAILLLIRPLIAHKLNDKNAVKTIYLTMYLIPALTVVHGVLGGLIYYLFAYITIIGSIVSIASHLACRLDQRMSALFFNSIKDARSIVILIGHWMLHAFGIIALTELREPAFNILLLLLVPLPTIFYILTSRFSDPSKLLVD